MYFPYLRGRQYEMIALRESLEKEILDINIVPIVEPVKLSSTFIKTLKKYVECNRTIGIIVNPSVGSFKKDLSEEKNAKLAEQFKEILISSNNILKIKLLTETDENLMFAGLEDLEEAVVFLNVDSIKIYESQYKEKFLKYCFIPDESSFRRKVRSGKVMLEDRFNKQSKNNDYINVIDEPFSEDHLFYREDNYIGFSDYSIVGAEYNDTGFAPYAVAIHILYFAEDKSLRVKHFVSDSNDDIKDPGRKFYEALNKLIEWNKEAQVRTGAMEEFQSLYERESYPGLGVVKKISIMHHLELMGKYLSERL